MLLIDWGCSPQIGSNLTPEFCIYCPGFGSRPHVHVRVDKRLDCEDWEEGPKLQQKDESIWVFYESLRLTSGGSDCRCGTYRIELHAVFHTGSGPAYCFQGVVRIKVTDTATDAKPVLEIDGDEGAMINLMGRDLSEFAAIRLKGGQRAAINIQENLFPESDAAQDDAKAQMQGFAMQLPLKPDFELQQHIPRLSSRGRHEWMDSAALTLPDGRRTLLLARSSVLCGRERNDRNGQKVCDIVLRLWPRITEDHAQLSAKISRSHFRLTLEEGGLTIEDESSFGTYLGGQRLTGPLTLRQNSPPRQMLAVAGILGLELTRHCDPMWRSLEQTLDLIESEYFRAAGVSEHELKPWQHARRTEFDAVRLRRRGKLPIHEYLPHLAQTLPPVHFESVREAAYRIDPTDALSGREEYVLVFRSATLGGSPDDAICLTGLQHAHARIFNLGGRFWLEHLAQYQETRVDGELIEPRELVPLAPGMELAFGQQLTRFETYCQCEFA